MLEHFFFCPYCGEEISMLVDPSIPTQQYIEDCEVCCNPIEIRYTVDEEELTAFAAESIEQ
ncbi:MAG: CPXCG motif-containing cysteine-rich protein [Bacteroidota bacterium]